MVELQYNLVRDLRVRHEQSIRNGVEDTLSKLAAGEIERMRAELQSAVDRAGAWSGGGGGMMSEYDDVAHYLDEGYWPGGTAPEWALVDAARLKTSPTNSVILMNAMQREIERLREELTRANAQLAVAGLDTARAVAAATVVIPCEILREE